MRLLFRWRKRRNEELNEEIQGHLELAARDNMESGLAQRDAQTVARHEFGSIALAEEAIRSNASEHARQLPAPFLPRLDLVNRFAT